MDNNDKKTNEYDVPLVDHEYDGIQELNNPAPFWWQLFFYLSIIFAVSYYFYYEVFDGPTSKEELAVKLAEARGVDTSKKQVVVSDDDIKSRMGNKEHMALAKTSYEQKCASCHAADGGGGIGPNLTDKFWVHDNGTPSQVLNIIKVGVPDKGMPAWGMLMKDDELISLAGYVLNFQGTKPAQPKAPQGNEVK